jgi:GNAT superfamily N-acetyltransferase
MLVISPFRETDACRASLNATSVSTLSFHRYADAVLTVRRVPHDDSVAIELWAEEWEELEGRYGGITDPATLEPDGLIASFVGYVGDEPVGTVVVRFAAYDGRAPEAEIKRLFVRAPHRGRGYSRVLMGAAEEAARRAGATRLILETGDRQPEAVALYGAIGYSRIPNFGKWATNRHSICMAKDVPTRVLVISGTIGAGKTTTAWATSDALVDRGARHAMIDADALAQGEPAPEGDPFNQELMFASLRSIAPHYRENGWGIVVIARVVEDPADRDRYASSFAGPGGPADVTIIRVTASEETRRRRVVDREPEGQWREWGLARTVELEAILEAAALEDAVIDNDGRDRASVADDVLMASGWINGMNRPEM